MIWSSRWRTWESIRRQQNAICKVKKTSTSMKWNIGILWEMADKRFKSMLRSRWISVLRHCATIAKEQRNRRQTSKTSAIPVNTVNHMRYYVPANIFRGGKGSSTRGLVLNLPHLHVLPLTACILSSPHRPEFSSWWSSFLSSRFAASMSPKI